MTVSSSFLELCRAQAALLVEGLGASLAVVYLARDAIETGQAHLVPVLVYPEPDMAASERSDEQRLPERSLGWRGFRRGAGDQSASGAAAYGGDGSQDDRSGYADLQSDQASGVAGGELDDWVDPMTTTTPRLLAPSQGPSESIATAGDDLARGSPADRRILLPLVWEGVALGLLAIDRPDRPWTVLERSHLERTAQTLAVAGAMDQRLQWLERAYRERERARDRQQGILHDLLHQFRNPLTAIRTFGKLLLRRAGADDRQKASVESLLREAERLQGLLVEFDRAIEPNHAPLALPAGTPLALLPGQDWVEPASIEPNIEPNWVEPNSIDAPNEPGQPMALSSGDRKVAAGVAGETTEAMPIRVSAIQPCDLRQALRTVLDSAEAVAADHGLYLAIDWPEDLPLVLADPTALVEVVGNLLDNAVKYSPTRELPISETNKERMIDPDQTHDRDPDILVMARSGAAGLVWAVSDRGLGIPAEDLAQLFRRGFRGEKVNSPIPGTGLGLALAQRLIQAMGGELQVFSPPVGLDRVVPLLAGDRAANPLASQGTTVILFLAIAPLSSSV